MTLELSMLFYDALHQNSKKFHKVVSEKDKAAKV